MVDKLESFVSAPDSKLEPEDCVLRLYGKPRPNLVGTVSLEVFASVKGRLDFFRMNLSAHRERFQITSFRVQFLF